MNSESNQSNSTFFFSIKKINSQRQLSSAFRHNKREIQAELGARSHIDAERMHLNYSLIEETTTSCLNSHIIDSIDSYEVNNKRRIRRDAVIAIEILFSIPTFSSDIDHRQYFSECFEWAKGEFFPAETLTAHVHLDESNPHLHVIFSCVTPTSLIGSTVKGNKKKFAERAERFYQSVARNYGFSRPPKKLGKADRTYLAKEVLAQVENTADPLTQSRLYQLIRGLIEADPAQFAIKLGIDIKPTPKKMRTVTQIMTSKGKGNERSDNL